MQKHRVTIELMPISYEIEAENEDKAKEYAMDCFFDEKVHEIFEHSEVLVEQL